MIVTKVSRTYQKSINTKNYGIPESWIKIEATMEAQIESGDDPSQVSKMLYEEVKKQVIGDTVAVIEQINASLRPAAPSTATTTPAAVVPGTAPRAL